MTPPTNTVTLDEARERIGDGVIYRAYPGAKAEDGDITSVSNFYVYVRFVGDRSAKACHPGDLEWTR